MKLIIQIPSYNEEHTLPATLAGLPRSIPGVDRVERLVIDDGSSDRTADVAKRHGADHVVRHAHNAGLAKAFMTGLDACLERGADIIVNVDADGAFDATQIGELIEPILAGRAEYVVGARPILQSHYSQIKKLLQLLGSSAVRRLSGANVQDAPCGFRAITRDAAMKLNVYNSYTYTLETIIQAGLKNIPVCSIPIRLNEETRPSRLMRNIWQYVWRSMGTIVRLVVIYRPFRAFMTLAAMFAALGVFFFARYAVLRFGFETEESLVGSVIAGLLFFSIAFISAIAAFLGDLHSMTRFLLEDVQAMLREQKYQRAIEDRESSMRIRAADMLQDDEQDDAA